MAATEMLLQETRGASERSRQFLLAQQHADGHWCGELEGDSILQSEYILLLAWLGKQDDPLARRAANHLLRQQQAHGGWSLYPGGELEISSSVKAYFALKLTGHAADSAPLTRARQAILAHGGADRVNSFTRFYLALLGQISYDHCPAIPPEFMLLPLRFPINIYRISAWSRTIFVPLSIMWAHRPQCSLDERFGIRELFRASPEQWPELEGPAAPDRRGLGWRRFFHRLDRWLKRCERLGIRPLRRRALERAEQWMLSRFANSDGLGAIFPPIIWSIIALKCLGYEDESEEVRYCHQQLRELMIEEGDTLRLQPCKSPVWDTALALRALNASGQSPRSDSVRFAARWLLEREVQRPGDWAMTVDSPPGGWFFEYRNEFYPDIDDTIMVMMAMKGAIRTEPGQSAPPHDKLNSGDAIPRADIADACERARRWVLAMQNRDGGWGAFDKDNDAEFLCHVPFADHNAMIDPSTPDITARVIEALGQWGMTRNDPPIQRALAYLRREQERDGSWIGRWGVNYIYGVWQVLAGLAAVDVSKDDPVMVEGGNWLLKHQQGSGGWGESAASYQDPRQRGQGPTTVSQTSWAILGLIAAGHGRHEAARRGVEFLLRQQRADGGWSEKEFTGTGFPQVFYLRYHLYPIYFPMLALSAWAQAQQQTTVRNPHATASASSSPGMEAA